MVHINCIYTTLIYQGPSVKAWTSLLMTSLFPPPGLPDSPVIPCYSSARLRWSICFSGGSQNCLSMNQGQEVAEVFGAAMWKAVKVVRPLAPEWHAPLGTNQILREKTPCRLYVVQDAEFHSPFPEPFSDILFPSSNDAWPCPFDRSFEGQRASPWVMGESWPERP